MTAKQKLEIAGAFGLLAVGLGIGVVFGSIQCGELAEQDARTIIVHACDGQGLALRHLSGGTHTNFVYACGGNVAGRIIIR